MRKIFFSLIFLVSAQSFCQIRTYSDCITAEKKAVEFSENGVFIVQSYGDLPEDYPSEFWNFYDFYVFTKFGISFEWNGCFSSETGICFGKKTQYLLDKKFGKNFLEELRKKLRNEFNQLTLQEKQSIIDDNKVYDTFLLALDSGVKYIGNDVRLEKLIKDKLIKHNLFIKADLELIINTNGRTIDLKYSNQKKK